MQLVITDQTPLAADCCGLGRMQAGRGVLAALTLCSVVFSSVDGMGVHSSGGSCPECASPAGETVMSAPDVTAANNSTGSGQSEIR